MTSSVPYKFQEIKTAWENVLKFDFQRHYSFSDVLTHGKHLLSPVHICDHVSGMRMSQTLCGNFVSYIKFYLVFGNAAYNKTGQNVSFLIL